ncbi:MAG: LysE family translocator [Neisseriaceae bacterium]|nr:LysE family translocator [Neisseriaceae bacterium]MBP6863092.1 LysE family translocator [Neisseriaceae bacterium]
MSLQLWLLYFPVLLVLSAAPGPNMLLAFQHGSLYGVKKTMMTLAGLSTGLFILIALSLSGVAALSAKYPLAFELFKVFGAGYLIYLGWQSWHQDHQGKMMASADTPAYIVPVPKRMYRLGLAVSLSNPKAIIFFAAFLPKFINHEAPLMAQYGVLLLTFFVVETTWQLVYASSGKALSAWLLRGRRWQWFNRACAVLFTLVGSTILWDVLHKWIDI